MQIEIALFGQKPKKNPNLKVFAVLKKTKVILRTAELSCGIIINCYNSERSFERASTVPLN